MISLLFFASLLSKFCPYKRRMVRKKSKELVWENSFTDVLYQQWWYSLSVSGIVSKLMRRKNSWCLFWAIEWVLASSWWNTSRRLLLLKLSIALSISSLSGLVLWYIFEAVPATSTFSIPTQGNWSLFPAIESKLLTYLWHRLIHLVTIISCQRLNNSFPNLVRSLVLTKWEDVEKYWFYLLHWKAEGVPLFGLFNFQSIELWLMNQSWNIDALQVPTRTTLSGPWCPVKESRESVHRPHRENQRYEPFFFPHTGFHRVES